MLDLLLSALFFLASSALAWREWKALRRALHKLRYPLAHREAQDVYHRHHPAWEDDLARWN